MNSRLAPWLGLLLLAGCDGADVPGAPPLNSGPASNTLFTPGSTDSVDTEAVAKAICTKMFQCIPSQGQEQGLMQQCVSQVQAFTVFIIDGAAFTSCFNALSCTQLQQYEKIGDYIQGCVDIDESSLACNGSAIHYCDRQGTCKDVPCSSFCSLLGQQGQRCISTNDGVACDCTEIDQQPQPMP